MQLREYNFDGLVGPTHNYAGLSPGNLASETHAGQLGNPRAAALQGLEKMRFVHELGVAQALLPPQPRPLFRVLRQLGFGGSEASILRAAASGDGQLLRLCSSASAMWTANAATVAPASDSADGRLHLTPANLSAMFHRSLEAPQTLRTLRAIFSDEERFVVHDPLPAGEHFSDEGAANHTRLFTSRGVVHLFGWGKQSFAKSASPQRFIARQTREASAALARLHQLDDGVVLLWQQAPVGIDAGAFHSDVLAVGHENFLMLHQYAFVNAPELLAALRARLGDDFRYCLATNDELPVADAVRAYPFNSQLLSLPNGKLAILAPAEALANPRTRAFLERVVSEDNPVSAVHAIDVNASMNNGGGPACLRLRVPLSEADRRAIRARVFFDLPLYSELTAWVKRHYRERITREDLAQPALAEESRAALAELANILELQHVYLESPVT